jgi:hypothetical protein
MLEKELLSPMLACAPDNRSQKVVFLREKCVQLQKKEVIPHHGATAVNLRPAVRE